MSDKSTARRAIEAMKAARRMADHVLDVAAVAPMKVAFSAETQRVVSEVAKQFWSYRNTSPTRALTLHFNQALNSRLGQAGASLGRVFAGLTKENLTEGFDSLKTFMGRMKHSPAPLDDLHTVGRMVESRRAKLEEMRARQTMSFANDTHKNIMAELKKATRQDEIKSVGDLLKRAEKKLDGAWWQIERIVKTETSAVYNLAQHDGLVALAKRSEYRGKLYKRWTELIDDLTGKPFDNRVAIDSFQLHGQIALPSGVFTMPPNAPVSHRLQGKTWSHPPNRPHDRAVLTPWMVNWGIPGWLWSQGKKIYL